MVLSRSPATGEVFVRCDCGAEYWENEGEVEEARIQREADAIDAAYEVYREDPSMDHLRAALEREAA